jgi:hypothetical protein
MRRSSSPNFRRFGFKSFDSSFIDFLPNTSWNSILHVLMRPSSSLNLRSRDTHTRFNTWVHQFAK